MTSKDPRDADYAGIIRKAGIGVRVAYCDTLEKVGEPVVVLSVEATIDGDDGDLTFEMLERAAVLMGTRKIDITCDLGCESDRSHDTLLVFHNPALPGGS